jgi:hypothetical protein
MADFKTLFSVAGVYAPPILQGQQVRGLVAFGATWTRARTVTLESSEDGLMSVRRLPSKVRPSRDTICVTEDRQAKETAMGLGDDADQARATQ